MRGAKASVPALDRHLPQYGNYALRGSQIGRGPEWKCSELAMVGAVAQCDDNVVKCTAMDGHLAM